MIDGEACIMTNLGIVPLKYAHNAETVLSWDGEHQVVRPILKWAKMGFQTVVKLYISKTCILRCTADHEIFTPRNWRSVTTIEKTHRIYCQDTVGIRPLATRKVASGRTSCSVYELTVDETRCFFANGVLVRG